MTSAGGHGAGGGLLPGFGFLVEPPVPLSLGFLLGGVLEDPLVPAFLLGSSGSLLLLLLFPISNLVRSHKFQ